MLIISLDESGSFERIEKNYIAEIGGLIFRIDEDNEQKAQALLNKENKRIQKYLSETCLQAGAPFPNGLHFNGAYLHSGNKKQPDGAKKLNEALNNTLFDFLKGEGKWSSNPPSGTYYSYALIGNDTGILQFSDRSAGNIVNDNYASNRYEHMAYRAIENNLIYNPLLENDNYLLLMAQRTLPFENADSSNNEIRTEMEKIGVSNKERKSRNTGKKQTNNSVQLYSVTNTDTYRAFVANAIQNSHKINASFAINVESINYNNYVKANGILYLTDIFCGILRSRHTALMQRIKKESDGTRRLEISRELNNFHNFLKKKLGKGRSFLWGYDDIDNQYHQAYRNFLSGNYFEALLLCNQMATASTSAADYYSEHWSETISDLIENSHQKQFLMAAVEKLFNYISLPDYRLTIAKSICSSLNIFADNNELDEREMHAKFLLKRIQMVLSNHEGNYTDAQVLFAECMKLAQYAGIEEVFELQNIRCVALLDQKHFEEARQVAEETWINEQLVFGLKEKYFPHIQSVGVHLGQTCSQCGQCCAFLEDYPKANRYFETALRHFGNDEVNKQKTRSYYLHALIEQGDKARYESVAAEYFGTANYKKQYQKEDKTAAKSFALFVYMKALYTFYADSIDAAFISKVIKYLKELYPSYGTVHPWELIFKYAYLLVRKKMPENKTLLKELKKTVTAFRNDGENSIINEIVRDFNTETKLTYMYR